MVGFYLTRGMRTLQVLLADFGEAKQLTQSLTHVSAAGTLVYMAPEMREADEAKTCDTPPPPPHFMLPTAYTDVPPYPPPLPSALTLRHPPFCNTYSSPLLGSAAE